MKLFKFLNLAADAAQTDLKLDFKPERFVQMMDEMGIGMLIIFILIGVIILTTVVVNKLFSNKK